MEKLLMRMLFLFEAVAPVYVKILFVAVAQAFVIISWLKNVILKITLQLAVTRL